MADDRQNRLDSQGTLVLVGDAPKITPRAAAYYRKLGMHIDPIEVDGVDDGKLDRDAAMKLRAAGVLVLDEEIA